MSSENNFDFIVKMCIDGWCESCKNKVEDCIKDGKCKGGPFKNAEEESV